MIEVISTLFPLLWVLVVTVIFYLFFCTIQPPTQCLSFRKKHGIMEAFRSSINHSLVRVSSQSVTQPETSSFSLFFPQHGWSNRFLFWLKPHIEPHRCRWHIADGVSILRKMFPTLKSLLAQINDIIGIVSACFPLLWKSSRVKSSHICCCFLLTGVHMQPLIHFMILVWTLGLSGKAHCAF